MDTAKVANLFASYPEADLLEFVNAPVGKGTPIAKTLKPLIAVPTTAGTGSETTGTAIFDYTPLSAKTGIASRAMRPTLGIVDPLNTVSSIALLVKNEPEAENLSSLTRLNFPPSMLLTTFIGVMPSTGAHISGFGYTLPRFGIVHRHSVHVSRSSSGQPA